METTIVYHPIEHFVKLSRWDLDGTGRCATSNTQLLGGDTLEGGTVDAGWLLSVVSDVDLELLKNENRQTECTL